MRKVLFILATLSDEDVDWLARAGRVVRPAAGTDVIRQNEPARELFFVLEGHVAVLLDGFGEVARLATGEVVGEMSFVDRAPPSATIRVQPGTTLLAIDKRDVEGKMAADQGFAARFYLAVAMFLSDRLRAANDAAAGRSNDELDESFLDGLSNAGQRFDMMLKKLLGGSAG